MNDEQNNSTSKQNASRPYIRAIRYIFQWILVLIVFMSGFSLYVFHGQLFDGDLPSFRKSVAVEGFMPIGALMSLKLWITKGIFDPVHPAALVIFIAALLLALFVKKGFCGWACPIGTISEAAWKIGRKMFGKNFILPNYLDYPLRSAKYILMTFFLIVILVKMSQDAIHAFLFTPYWKAADFKLLLFFTDMSLTTGIVVLTLVISSLFLKNFWCRYFCPYGALLGLLSMASPLKVTRNDGKCIHCMTCTGNCPSMLPVESKERLSSPECMGCLTCVSKCPSEGALDVAFPIRNRANPLIFIILIALIFWGIITIAMATGYWNSGVTNAEYSNIIPYLDRLEHP